MLMEGFDSHQKHLHVLWMAKTSCFLGTNYTSFPGDYEIIFLTFAWFTALETFKTDCWSASRHWYYETCLSFLFKKCFSDYTSNYMLTVENLKKTEKYKKKKKNHI